MPRLITAVPFALVCAALAGCAALPQGRDAATRLDTMPLVFENRAQDAAYLAEQAEMLTHMAKDIRRKSMLHGAAVGAAIGCGIGVVSGSGAERCLIGAAAGGLTGAIAGDRAGQRDVARRLGAATPDSLLRGLRTTGDHVGKMRATLAHVLAEQDATLAQLQSRLARGESSQATHDAGVQDIRQSRAALAEALMTSGKQLRASRETLQNAVGRGQSRLELHLDTTKALELEIYSARSGITLL